MVKKQFLWALAVLMLLLWGCAAKQPEQPLPLAKSETNRTVGICLPDGSWAPQGQKMTALLSAAGFDVLTEYAAGDSQLQLNQVQALVRQPVGCLVVAAIDSMNLSEALAQAKQAGIPVIAYDRMLMYTDAVTGCVATDSYKAGQQMARYIIEKEQLSTATEPVTIEFFMGSPEDSSAFLLYEGLMELLQPYLNSGALQCRSGRTAFEDTCVLDGTAQTAMDYCSDYLISHYNEAAPDVLCAASDILAQGCINALTSLALQPGEGWPLITGMGASDEGKDNILQGLQGMGLFVDTDALVQHCVLWVLAAVKDSGNMSTDTFQNNGCIDVPCALLDAALVESDDLDTASTLYGG